MAKSSRASTIKANNRRLKRNVFGPVEAARLERLSAKLRDIAAQPKPAQEVAEVEMKPVEEAAEADHADPASETVPEATTMEVDSVKPASKRSERKRIEKHKKPSKIVFPKYKDRQTKKR